MVATTAERPVPTPVGEHRRTGALGWLGQVAAWFVILGVGSVLLVAVVVPRVAGGTAYVIETGSMRPDLPPGTLAVVRPGDPTDVAVGDVITYQPRSGDPAVVTHRVETVGYDGADGVRWQTKGDTNDLADPDWVVPAQLRGEVWYAVPYLGHAGALLTGDQRGLLTGLLVLGLVGYGLVQFRGALVERRGRRKAGGPA
jgi:signal peptidase